MNNSSPEEIAVNLVYQQGCVDPVEVVSRSLQILQGLQEIPVLLSYIQLAETVEGELVDVDLLRRRAVLKINKTTTSSGLVVDELAIPLISKKAPQAATLDALLSNMKLLEKTIVYIVPKMASLSQAVAAKYGQDVAMEYAGCAIWFMQPGQTDEQDSK